jgi:hypothetical protein
VLEGQLKIWSHVWRVTLVLTSDVSSNTSTVRQIART